GSTIFIYHARASSFMRMTRSTSSASCVRVSRVRASCPNQCFRRRASRRSRQAFWMLWAHRVRWLLLLLTYYVVLLTIRAVPYAGLFVVPMLKPVFAVGFLAAAWSH